MIQLIVTKEEEESFFSSEDGDSKLSSKKCRIKDKAMNYETITRGFKHEGRKSLLRLRQIK